MAAEKRNDLKGNVQTPKDPVGRSNSDELMKKILIIEGQPEMRRNLTTILQLEKFQPLSAENGGLACF